MSLIDRAHLFAEDAHAAVGHLRKYTNEPYIVHPREVVSMVALVTDDEAMIAAAYLHDTVEDTEVTIEEIEAKFGKDVARLVFELTTPEMEGNRATRAAAELERLKGISARAQTIKLADIVSNVVSIAKRDPKFAKVYLPEKKMQVGILSKGDEILRKVASEVIDKFIAYLGEQE